MNANKNNIIILLLVGLLFITFNIQAQETEKKLTGKEKKELKKKKMLEEKSKVVHLLKTKKWIIEFDLLYDRNSQNKQLNPLQNFIGVNDDMGILKNISKSSKVIEGKISDFKIIEGKERAQPMVKYHFIGDDQGSLLKTDIMITVNNDFRCNVIFRYDLGDQVSYRGRLVPWEQSRVSKKGY